MLGFSDIIPLFSCFFILHLIKTIFLTKKFAFLPGLIMFLNISIHIISINIYKENDYNAKKFIYSYMPLAIRYHRSKDNQTAKGRIADKAVIALYDVWYKNSCN